jgi:hypothetical protein
MTTENGKNDKKRKKNIENDLEKSIVKKICNNNNICDELKKIENRFIEYDNKRDKNNDDLKKKKAILDNNIVEFLCSKNLDDIYNLNVKFVNKLYDKNILFLEELTQSKTIIFKKHHIEKLFQDKDIQTVKCFVHSFVITINCNKDSLMITNSNEGLDMLKMNCFVRFFIIGIKNNCNTGVPNIRDIFSDENNLESININSSYYVVMDRKIIINVDTGKLSEYYIFIKWLLDSDICKDGNDKMDFFYGWESTYPKFLTHNFGTINDKFKQVYFDVNCNNSKQQQTNEELRKTANELIERVKFLEEITKKTKQGN